MARVAAKADQESGEKPDPAEKHAAMAEPKADIRDEIQKLVGTRPRRAKAEPEPEAARATAEAEVFVAPEILVTVQPVAVKSEPGHETGAFMGEQLVSHEAPIAPATVFGNEVEHAARTKRFSNGAYPAAGQGVAQFPVMQVAPLNLEEELRRVAETLEATTRHSNRQAVSALLDQVIAVSSHPSRREPEQEQKREAAEPVVTAASRSLLQVQVVEEYSECSSLELQKRLEADDTAEVVVAVQTVEEPEPLVEVEDYVSPSEPSSYEPTVKPPSETVKEYEATPVIEQAILEPAVIEPGVMEAAVIVPAVIAQASIEQPELDLSIPTETASWSPTRPIPRPNSELQPSDSQAVPEIALQPTTSVDEPGNLTCFEDQKAIEVPQIPEPAVFQAMIGSISLDPNPDQPAAWKFEPHPSTSSAVQTNELNLDHTGVHNSDEPLPGQSHGENSALLLPTGMHDRVTFSRLLEAPGVLSGVVVSIGLNDYKKIQDSFAQPPFEDLMRSVNKLMNGMIRDKDFGVRLEDCDWVFVYRDEVGAAAQKRILQISEKLWDFQLRSMGSVSILFGWGAVEVEKERLSEAYNASIERMEQSRRGRKTVAMDSRDKRRAVNG